MKFEFDGLDFGDTGTKIDTSEAATIANHLFRMHRNRYRDQFIKEIAETSEEIKRRFDDDKEVEYLRGYRKGLERCLAWWFAWSQS